MLGLNPECLHGESVNSVIEDRLKYKRLYETQLKKSNERQYAYQQLNNRHVRVRTRR